MKFVIEGPSKLTGRIRPAGAKNSALKLIAGSLLTQETVVINNIPKIGDIFQLVKIITDMGASAVWQGNKLTINTNKLQNAIPNENLVCHLRGSVVLLGPLLARFGKVKMTYPGGCNIGARSLNTHLNAFLQFGVKVKFDDKYIELSLPGKIKTTRTVTLTQMSVTATENMLLLASGLRGKTIIKMSALEPEIINLVFLLDKMGAKITGTNTHTLLVQGKSNLGGASIKIIPDRIEAGTYICGALASQGELVVESIIPDHMESFLNVISQMGAKYNFAPTGAINNATDIGDLTIFPCKKLKASNIDTRPYPGFPTDLQSPFALLATQAQGKTRIFETLFEGRFAYVPYLKAMGADVKILTEHIIEINGKTPLSGGRVDSLDLRGGATLVLAGAIAQGKTIIKHAEVIDRGYEKIESKLTGLGVNIKRV